VTTRGVAGLAVADAAVKMPSSAADGVKGWGCGRLLLLSCTHLLLLTRRSTGMAEEARSNRRKLATGQIFHSTLRIIQYPRPATAVHALVV
jgi:hypothetical protein